MGTQTQSVCDSFKQAILGGSSINMSSDTVKCALYTSSATLGASTTNYTSTGEVSGTGYTAGGQTLSGLTTGLSSNTAYLTWSNPSWTGSTLTGVVAALIYDSTAGVAIAVLTFSSTSTTDGTFTLVFPSAGASSTITLT
jgi:hypothetical protein